MTEAELTKFLETNKEAIFAASRDAIIEKIKENLRWSMPEVLQNTVNTFLVAEIVPEIQKLLMEQRGVILEAAKKTAASLSDKLAEKMLEQVVQGLDGYRAEAVFKALLGIKERY